METKLKILDELDRNSSGLHLRQLTKNVQGSFPNIIRFVQILEKEGVVKAEQKANLLNITLKDSPQTVAYLKMVHTFRFLFLSVPQQNAIKDFLSKLPIKPLILSISSDFTQINLVFQKVENEKEIQNIANLINRQYQTKLSIKILDYLNVEKKPEEVQNNSSIIFLGIEHYYNLIWRKKEW